MKQCINNTFLLTTDKIHFMGMEWNNKIDFIMTFVILFLLLAIAASIIKRIINLIQDIMARFGYGKSYEAQMYRRSASYNSSKRRKKMFIKQIENDYWADAEHDVHRKLSKYKGNIINFRNVQDIRFFEGKDGICLSGKAFNDVYLRDLDDNENDCFTAQVDEIVVTKKALYFIECKTYDGKVKVLENEDFWIHNRNDTFSPYFQNKGHINFFNTFGKRYIANNIWSRVEPSALNNLPIYNIICFSDKTKVKEGRYNGFILVKVKNLLKTLSSIDATIKTTMDDICYEEITDYLENCVGERTSDLIKQRHLDMVEGHSVEPGTYSLNIY